MQLTTTKHRHTRLRRNETASQNVSESRACSRDANILVPCCLFLRIESWLGKETFGLHRAATTTRTNEDFLYVNNPASWIHQQVCLQKKNMWRTSACHSTAAKCKTSVRKAGLGDDNPHRVEPESHVVNLGDLGPRCLQHDSCSYKAMALLLHQHGQSRFFTVYVDLNRR